MHADGRAHAPATLRNREPILGVLRGVLDASRGPRRVLEVASGTGEHAVFFAAALPHVSWLPSDPDPGALASIEAWRVASGLTNVRPAIRLDVTAAWPAEARGHDTIFCANMIHIAPWEACLGLWRGAAETGVRTVVIYGPFMLGGRHTAPSNEAFDQSLRARDPRWGVRDLDDVARVAGEVGFLLAERHEMPANNQTLVFSRAPPLDGRR